MNPLKLMFVRHAQSVGNVERRMQGCADYPLTEEGKRQAARLAERLRQEGWHPTHIYSSPLKRAAQTAEILLSHFLTDFLPTSVRDEMGVNDVNIPEQELPLTGLAGDEHPPIPLVFSKDLVEHKNGVFQGLTWAEAQAQYPELCHRLEASLDWIPIPEAETLEEARDRTHHFVHQLIDQHQNGDHVLVVTHSWLLQHLIAALLGSDRTWRIVSNNTGLFEFWIERSRWNRTDDSRFNTDLWQIRRINDAQHLKTKG
ncbi:histidine phosphatase family protein [Vacuolonema iberomarrocanum]|uniref:histidine phosphatase family protein n=1 Tax=Vacuolonema iberomarrocanum TaxID=3454632 RepID=UPI001A034C36|nr:histidine phosphatase family protein [filamentous cyanobacterium LEGE 07170]